MLKERACWLHPPRLVTKTDVAPCVGIKAKTVAFSTTFEAMKKPANVSLFTSDPVTPITLQILLFCIISAKKTSRRPLTIKTGGLSLLIIENKNTLETCLSR